MITPLPTAVIDAPAPTSRSTFRLLARCLDATNRDADTLRHALLSQWGEHEGVPELVYQLQMLDDADPNGMLGVESRLSVWFGHAAPGDGRLVAENDPVLKGVADDLRTRLSTVTRTVGD